MATLKHHQSAVLLMLGIAASLFVFPFGAFGQSLPSRMFAIKDGSVEMQGGLLGSQDDVMLFMVLTNKSEQTVWAAVEFHPPDSGTVMKGFEKIKEGEDKMFKWPLPKIAWDTEYTFSVSVSDDEERTKPLGEEKSFFFFEGGKDRAAFEGNRQKLQPGQAMVVNGFRELTKTSLTVKVAGTIADTQLQGDITQRLFAEESKSRKTCEHRVVKAEPYGKSDPSIIAAAMGGKALELEEKLRAKGDMIVEKWYVQSCETMTAYEVLMLKSGSGTDIMVKEVGPAK